MGRRKFWDRISDRYAKDKIKDMGSNEKNYRSHKSN